MRLGFKIPRKPSQIYSALGLNDVPLVGSAKLFRQLYLSISLSLFFKLEYSNFILSHLREDLLALYQLPEHPETAEGNKFTGV